jgi:hypothetical protein
MHHASKLTNHLSINLIILYNAQLNISHLEIFGNISIIKDFNTLTYAIQHTKKSKFK